MISRALRQIVYENHYRVFCALGEDLYGCAFVDTENQCIWCDSSDSEHVAALMTANARMGRVDVERSELQLRDMDGGLTACVQAVVDDNEAVVMRVLLLVHTAAAHDTGIDISVGGLLDGVVSSISTEYQLNQELEAMASELGERYEELNLVFKSDAIKPKELFGLESLRVLVKDTTDFLGVGMAALVMPSKHFELFEFSRDVKIEDTKGLFAQIVHACFAHLDENTVAIVINNERDFAQYSLEGSFKYKSMMIPVKNSAGSPIGALFIANSRGHVDFRNSDRNLLEVMAGKVTKVLQVNFDSLTGLENSQSFEWAIGQALLQARIRGQQHAVLYVNIDRTGIVNDVSGRHAGDELIRRVSRELQLAVRSHDSVARIGGDEFGVLLETCSLSSAANLARKLSHRIENLDFEWSGTMHPVSVCIGVAPLTAESESVSTVLSSAGVARDAAKERGRNRIQVYETNDLELLRRRGEFQWVGRIQYALREGLFLLYGQLIKPLSDNDQPPHFEVLLRMQNDKGEVISPGQFIPAAEHFHLMPEIDRWVIKNAFNALQGAVDQQGRAPILLSVNLSGQTLSDDKMLEFVCSELNRLGPLAGNVSFEITESAAIANMDDALDFIESVKTFGCRFSLDDFGSGLSSFAYLKRFNVDFLKIDGSFVRHIHEDEVSAAMVGAINQVGQIMGLCTIAEFVENQEIVDKLRAIGVDFAQGYHYGRPAPLATVLRGCQQTHKALPG